MTLYSKCLRKMPAVTWENKNLINLCIYFFIQQQHNGQEAAYKVHGWYTSNKIEKLYIKLLKNKRQNIQMYEQ